MSNHFTISKGLSFEAVFVYSFSSDSKDFTMTFWSGSNREVEVYEVLHFRAIELVFSYHYIIIGIINDKPFHLFNL